MNYIESNPCDPCYRTSAVARHASQQLLLNAYCHSMDGPHYGRHCTFCLWIILCGILGEDFCSLSKLIFWYSTCIMVKGLTGLFNLTCSFVFLFNETNIILICIFLITTQCLKDWGIISTKSSVFFIWCFIIDSHFVICGDG